MFEGRSMTSLVALPNGKVLCLNGANTGVSGYGNTSWSIGQSYADNPVMTPAIYDPSAAAGKRWTRDGISKSTVPRMYHSSAILLADGAVIVSGSNPNADYTVGSGVTYPTEYRVERFYPDYYNERRPEPQGLPSQLSYGGAYFNVSLSSDDLFGNVQNAASATVVLIRTGFSTHAISMGQRFVQLNSTYTGNADGSAVLHVSQLPPNAAILAPGPACEHSLPPFLFCLSLSLTFFPQVLFVVVNGVPSVGVMVMVGSGKIGTQTMSAVADLPAATIVSNSTTTSGQDNSSTKSSGALPASIGLHGIYALLAPVLLAGLLLVR